ncbi:hypothetical protein AB4304_00975 [Vibrio breoganii]|uniref:hypothetical protein n=1 Tax=Vibrio breoganii TaxID=553239 RepID=UPI000C833D01|nr:hypothetical protein [Vibrio breoganii]PMK31116.1 hypothetical protein BCU03_07790 [Vibrio breoganii]
MDNREGVKKTSLEVQTKLSEVDLAKRKAEVVTLRQWYDSTEYVGPEMSSYMEEFKQLGRLGKELHNRGVPRVTERFGDRKRTLIEATYVRGILDFAAPLCALACIYNKKR